ncbi:hypothetical protein KI387_011431, partial [Taxus chinensis]
RKGFFESRKSIRSDRENPDLYLTEQRQVKRQGELAARESKPRTATGYQSP